MKYSIKLQGKQAEELHHTGNATYLMSAATVEIIIYLTTLYIVLWLTLVTIALLEPKHKTASVTFCLGVHLICKGLRWIVNDDGLWQVSAQDVEVLDVVSLDTDTMLTKQPVSTVTVERREKENQSVTGTEQSIIQKNHNTDTSTAAHANITAALSFELDLLSFRLVSAFEFVVQL